MKVHIIDNLDATAELLDYAGAEQVATLIRENTKVMNQGQYSESELEKLYGFATPETIQKEGGRGFLALLFSDEGNLVGCALVIKIGTMPFLKTIQVSKNFSRRGYGTLLYRHCEERIRKARLQEIKVQVPKFPSAEAFYKKHGFVKTGNPTHKDLYFAMYKSF